MPHSRLPLWHRVSVLLIVTIISAAILVWGYILNVGTLTVHVQPGDVVLVDGDDYPRDGRVRAGARVVSVQRAHHATFRAEIDVPRDGVAELTPTLEFLPYREQGRAATLPVVPAIAQADGCIETLESVVSAPEAAIAPTLLPTNVAAARVSADGSRAWFGIADGTEEVRTFADGYKQWSGATVGRAFRGTTFLAATRSGSGVTVTAHAQDGTASPLGTVDADATVTLVPHPTSEDMLVINDATGMASIIGPSGRVRLPLREAAIDARWSPDGAFILFQTRLPGAEGATKLVSYDVASQEEHALDVRATLALATFLPSSARIIAIERIATSNTTREEMQRLLTDTRVRGLVDALEQDALTIDAFQDALPADLRLATNLVSLDPRTGVRTALTLDGDAFTSEVLRLDPGMAPGTVDVLLPTHLETIVLEPQLAA